ncbi:MAG: tetratricopeptide repeat protein [Candidatus Aceula meridiana]|nr:tetratricopeptide repeat protein [Candidatus Aceula meridiana]
MPTRLKIFQICLLFFLVGLLIYANSFHAGFQLDDYKIIVENSVIPHAHDPIFIWKFDPSRFLPHYSFALNYAWGEFDVFSYHVVNVVFHILNTLLVFIFLKSFFSRFLKDSSLTDQAKEIIIFFSSLLFLVHPLQTSAVTYIVQRSTLMVTFFYLLGLISYLFFREGGQKRWYIASLVCVFFGALSKPNIITFPLILFALEFYFLSQSPKEKKGRWRTILPFLLIAFLTWPFLLIWKNGQFNLFQMMEVTRQSHLISRYTYFSTQMNVIVKYLSLILFPVNQNLDYDFPLSGGLLTIPTFFSFLAVIGLIYFTFRIYSKNKLASFGLLWFFITLAPESSFYPLSDVIFEHRLYLPLVGMSIFLVSFLAPFLKNRKVLILILSVFIIFFSILTVRRNAIWANQQELISDTIAKSPNKPRPLNNLADFYLREGNAAMAEEIIRKTVRLNEEIPRYHYNLGVVLQKQGRTDEAKKEYYKAVMLDEGYAEPVYYYNLGQIYQEQGDLERAEMLYQGALSIEPRYADVYANLGNLYTSQEKLSKAVATYNQALKHNPYHVNARNGLATVYCMEKKYDQSIKEFEHILRIDPEFNVARNNLGKVYVWKKDFKRAEEIFKDALKHHSQDIETLGNLANLYIGMKRFEQAQACALEAVDVLKKEGRTEEAEIFRKRFFKETKVLDENDTP